MEKIILSGKEYQNLANRSKVKKNMLFYNENNEILIYQYIKERVNSIYLQSKQNWIKNFSIKFAK